MFSIDIGEWGICKHDKHLILFVKVNETPQNMLEFENTTLADKATDSEYDKEFVFYMSYANNIRTFN